MRVKVVTSRPAPGSLRDLISRAVRGRGPAVSVERQQVPYWQERGWKQSGNTYTGFVPDALRGVLGRDPAALRQ
jgi:hypothetical protein